MLACLVAALAIATQAAPEPTAADRHVIELSVELDDMAKNKLVRLGERVRVYLFLQEDNDEGGLDHVVFDGELPATGGTLRMAFEMVTPVSGTIQFANIMVVTARRADPMNLIDCHEPSLEVSRLPQKVAVDCELIFPDER